MEEKRRLEQFRVQQFSTPHAAIVAGAQPELAGAQLAAAPVPDQAASRVILHFDSDAFCAPFARPAVPLSCAARAGVAWTCSDSNCSATLGGACSCAACTAA